MGKIKRGDDGARADMPVSGDQLQALQRELQEQTQLREQEVEKRRRLESVLLKALWRSEAHRRLAESNIIGVLFVDTAGKITDANDEFLRMLGYQREELSFSSLCFEDLTPAEYRSLDQTRLEELERRGVATPWEKEHIGKDGMRVPVLVGAALLEGSDRKAIAFVLDLTERKRAEEKAARYAAELREKNEQLEEDLRMAREIQQAFLPQNYPRFPQMAKDEESALRFCHRYFPAGPVGGDFFDVLSISDSQAGVIICDVMGHGVRAALVTGMMRTLVEQLRPVSTDAGRMMTEINHGLLATLRQSGAPMFVSACYAVLDVAKGELQLANAGHPSPIALRRDEGRVEVLGHRHGPALGLLDRIVYESSRYPLAPRDGLLLFTDGIYDVEDPLGEQLNPELLVAAIQARLPLANTSLVDELLADLRRRSATHRFVDDVCLLGIDVEWVGCKVEAINTTLRAVEAPTG